MRLSATRIKTYLTCPRQFRYSYVEHISTPLTGPLAFGQVMHKTLNYLHETSLASGEPLNLAFAYQEFDRLWRKALVEEQPIFKEGKDTIEQYWTLADEILRGYIAANKDTPPLLLEFPFELAWSEQEAAPADANGKGHILSGIIDRIDESGNSLVIVDFKTGQRKPKVEELDNDLQLTMYAYAVEQLFGQRVEQVIYYHLRDQTRLTTRRSENDYRQLCEEILPHVMQAIEGGMFSPYYGYWCRFCSYRELCKAEGPELQLYPEQPPALSQVTIY